MRLLRTIRVSLIIAVAPTVALTSSPSRAQDVAEQERVVSINGVQRSYLVHAPSNLPSPAPIVFIFHGGGGRPESIERRTGMDDLADRNGFVAVYPAGSDRTSGPGGNWNVGRSASPSSADDVSFVKAILRDIGKTTPIDSSRVYATGVSLGGMFAYRLACKMSGTFAAIAPVAATMVEAGCRPQTPVAVLHIHGANDDRIPLKGGRGEMSVGGRSWPAPQQGFLSWSRMDGCTGQATNTEEGSEACTTYTQCRATVEYCVASGGGHDWPAGASEQIWAFFAAHPKQMH